MWKKEYEENRRKKIESDPEYKAKVESYAKSRTPEENKEYMRAYYLANKPKFKRTREQQDAFNAKRRERYRLDEAFREKCKQNSRAIDKDTKRSRALKYNFGIDSSAYDAMLSEQGGGCAICGCPDGDSTKKRLHIDHCHTTGLVRGILCSSCNFGLGKFRDSPELLTKAISYLKAHEENNGRD